jgi:hypothetical protein
MEILLKMYKVPHRDFIQCRAKRLAFLILRTPYGESNPLVYPDALNHDI